MRSMQPARLPGPPARPKRFHARAGLTVVELLMALIVMLVAVGGMLGSISSFVVLGDSAHEKTLALLEAQLTLERMQGENFRQVFARFNATTADDPAGPVSPGADFAVAGLAPRPDDADGLVGRILFPTPPGAPDSLREDAVDAEFGFPRDLNGDGVIDAAEHSGDYVVLPVRILIEWRGNAGNRVVELQTVLRNS